MGRHSLEDMLSVTDRATTLRWHLQHNHYPPVPLAMLPVCKAAIEALENGEPNLEITLPDGVTFRGDRAPRAWRLVAALHLDAFVQ